MSQLSRPLRGSPGHHRRSSPAFRSGKIRPGKIRPGKIRSGQIRPDATRAAHLMPTALASLIVFGLTALIGYFVIAQQRRGGVAEASASAALDSRSTDPAPLTVDEVFPGPDVRGYHVTATRSGTCSGATTGNLGPILAEQGCSQVVRAALTPPYGDYQVTAGLFNLADAKGAADVDGRLRSIIETGDGNFAPLATGNAGSQVGWHSHGHYLAYCVIIHPDGTVVAGDDPNAARITADLVDGYLRGTVLGKRS